VDTDSFLSNLELLSNTIANPWLVIGDFNLIRSAQDKNNSNVNGRLIRAFNDCIHNSALLELPLLDRLFTWSNMRDSPTLARLDRAFINNAFNTSFPHTHLSSLPRPTSDHVPLLATIATSVPVCRPFRFERSWLLHNDFLPSILPAWSAPPLSGNSVGSIVAKVKAVRHAAKVWARKKKSPSTIHSNCTFIVLLLDLFEEHRDLSSGELCLRRLCRNRVELITRERAAH
jgi:hypothetical protein